MNKKYSDRKFEKIVFILFTPFFIIYATILSFVGSLILAVISFPSDLHDIVRKAINSWTDLRDELWKSSKIIEQDEPEDLGW